MHLKHICSFTGPHLHDVICNEYKYLARKNDIFTVQPGLVHTKIFNNKSRSSIKTQDDLRKDERDAADEDGGVVWLVPLQHFVEGQNEFPVTLKVLPDPL